MKRSVRKFGLAAAVVLGTLAFGATPARAQVYVSRYYAPTPVTTYYYTPSQSPDGTTSYYYAPAYSYSWTPECCYYHVYRGCWTGWRSRSVWYRTGWRNRCW